jgi:hypothetical protein
MVMQFFHSTLFEMVTVNKFLQCYPLSLTTHSGLEIWRIEKLQAVPVCKESYGKFFTGDSYIILKVLKFSLVGNVHILAFSSVGKKYCKLLDVSSVNFPVALSHSSNGH